MFNKKKKESDIEMVLLRTAGNNYEIGLIQSLLEQENIPFITKDKGVGGYMRIYTGASVFGTDFLVEKSLYDRAAELLEGIEWENP